MMRRLELLYSHSHHHCETELAYKNPTGLDAIVNRVLERTHSGKLKAGDIDSELWLANAKKIWEGGAEGLGVNWTSSIERIGNVLHLHQNAYVFAAFKNHRNINSIVRELTEKGVPRGFDAFKKAAMPLMDKYNMNWLRAEFNQATASARMADKWTELSARGGKLEYVTVGDDRVRFEHDLLNGTILPFDHSFWDKYYPPNGWNCRCTVRWRSDEAQNQSPQGLPSDIPPEMQFNPGKQGLLFSTSHPYFNHLPETAKRHVYQQIETMKDKAEPFTVWQKGKTSVKVHPFAHLDDAPANVRAGILIAREEKLSVEVLQHSNIKKVKQPELKIGKLPGDLKSPEPNSSSGVRNRFRKLGQQVNHNDAVMVFEIGPEHNLDGFARQLSGAWKKRKWCKEVIVIRTPKKGKEIVARFKHGTTVDKVKEQLK